MVRNEAATFETKATTGQLLADFRYRVPGRYLVSWLALIAVSIVVLIAAPATFSVLSLQLVTTLAGILILASLGQMVVIMIGSIDLSVPAQITLSAGLLVFSSTFVPTPVAVLIALVGCAIVGTVNGLLVSVLRLNSLIVTLAMNGIVLGLVVLVFGQKFSDTGQAPVALQKLTTVNFGPFNLILVFAVAVSVVMALYLYRTRFGRQIGAVGANRVAAHALGIPVTRVEVSTFALAGVLYGLAGTALAAWVSTPTTILGSPYALSTITTLAVAGALFSGGPASLTAANVSAIVLTVLAQALQVLNLGAGAGFLVQGIILVLAVSILTLTERGRDSLLRLRRNLSSLKRSDAVPQQKYGHTR